MATILIVDDRPANREFLMTLLGYGGHRLLEADNGPDGLRVARAEKPDLAIVDILMPGMDGFQFVQALRSDPAIRQTRIVFYTAAYREAEALALARRCGVTRIITKPAEPEQILRTVAEALAEPPADPAITPEEFTKEHAQLLTTKVFEKEAELATVSQKLERLAVQNELILNSIHDGIYGLDLEGRATFMNPAAARMTGYSVNEVLGRPMHELVHHTRADGTPITHEECKTYRAFREGVVIQADDEVFWRKDGTSFPVEYTSSPILEGDKIVGAVVAFRDISKRLENKRRLQEQAAMLDKASDAILVRDLEQRITYWNKSAELLYGWSAGEALGRHGWELLFDPQSRPALEKAHEELLAKGEWSGELRPRTRDGRQLVTFCRWTLLRDPQGRPTGTLVINTDITEKKKLEQQYLRAQRMESLGTLAGGVAHDLNNVLTPIMMALELLRPKLSDPASKAIMETLTASVRRGADMVKQVLSFSRGVEGERVPILLKHIIKETRTLLEHSLSKGIEVQTAVAPDLWLVLGDVTHMTQMLMNLCVNARDAMPQGGTLTIEAHNQVIDETYARMHPEAKPGRYVVVTVSDTGTGIPREHLDKIFEPFFTTKGPGKGTGLGLTTVLGIVKGHGGFVNVYSEVGRGTKFNVYLPAVSVEEAGEQSQKPAARLPEGAGEWILVVDDEAAIRGIARATLEAHGYRVLTAGDGAEALAVFADHRDKIQAVLMDMMMPVMDGPTTIRALRKMNDRMPIIAVSGLVENSRSIEIATLGVKIFLKKPYTGEALLEALHSALHEEAAKLAAAGGTK